MDQVRDLVHRASGRAVSEVIELQRRPEGGWEAVVESSDPVTSPGDEPRDVVRHRVSLDEAGEPLSFQRIDHSGPGLVGAAGQPTEPVPVDLGLRADLDTDIDIGFRRFELIRLRLRGLIRPSRGRDDDKPAGSHPAD